MDVSPAGIAVLDRAGPITAAKRRAEELLGLSRAEIMTRDYDASAWHITDHHGRELPAEALPFRRVLATGEPVYGGEVAMLRRPGERLPLTVNAVPLLDARSEFRSVVVAFEDVTAQVRSAREPQHRAILQHAWLDAVPVPVYYTAPDDRIAGCDDALAGMTCLPRGQIVEQRQSLLLLAAQAAELPLASQPDPPVATTSQVVMPVRGSEAMPGRTITMVVLPLTPEAPASESP